MSKIYEHFDQRYYSIMNKASSYWNKMCPGYNVHFLEILIGLDEKGLIRLVYTFDYEADKYLSNYNELDVKGEDLAKELSEFFNCKIVYETCALFNVLEDSKTQFTYTFRFDKDYIDMIFSFLRMV